MCKLENDQLDLRKSPCFPCHVRWKFGWWYAAEEFGFMRCQRQRVRRACTCWTPRKELSWACTWCVCVCVLMAGAGGGTDHCGSTHCLCLSDHHTHTYIYTYADKHMHTDGTTPEQHKLHFHYLISNIIIRSNNLK